MRALIVYFSRSGATERLMKAVGESLESWGHRAEYFKIEPERRMSWLGAGWAALRKREAKIVGDLPRSLRTYDLVLVAAPVFAGKPPAEMNTFLKNMPDAVGRRVGVFATMGSANADGQLRLMKLSVEKAGGMIIYEDAVRRSTAMNSAACKDRAREIVDQLLRPSVW